MDGSDASLIEISEEDDSLLSSPLLPTDAASPPSSFACSPLVRFPRPPLPGSSSRRSRLPPLPLGGGREEGREPGSKDGSEKENDEVNKLEAGKLSLEPQQMKRKKKGAGFNLRKSLAWNRAFFTEEGVLDPSELSMLSGNTGDSTGLSTIQEGIESLCSGSDAANTSPSLRKLENKLSGELPVNSVIQGRKLKRTMLPKPGSATKDKSGSVSAAKRKVIASPDANKSASKRGGYPLSTALSSLRKPSTGSMTKVVNKGSKLSRLFTSKPDPAIASVSRSHTVAASQLKQNQIAKPVTIQKSDAAKITSANVKAVRENVKCAPLGNSLRKPIEQFKRNVVRSGSSANVRHHATNQTADKEAKVRDVLLHPAACSPNVADVGVLKTVNSFSQNANVRHTQPQAAKPSGLRMPSPSLGYFSESKTSGSQSLPQRTQLCNLQQSGIPTSASAGVLKPTQLRPPLPRKKMDHSSTGNLIASMANPVLHGKGKCNAQSDAIRDLEVEVLCSSKSLKSNPLVHSITSNELQNFDLGRPNNDGNVSDTEDQMPLSNLQNGATKLSKLDVGDNERVTIADSQQKSTELISDHLMVAPHLSLQAVTEVLSETQTMTSGQEVDPLFHNIASNHVISSEVQFENVNCNIENNVSKVPENRSRSMHDGKKQLQEQAETKPFVDADSEWLMTEKSLKTADGSRVNDLENLSDCLSFCEGAEEVKCVADEADHLSKASQVGDANVQAIDFDVPVQEVDPLFHNIASSRVISSRVQFENANCNIEKDVSKVSANRSCSMHDGNKQLQEQAEMKPFVDADSEWIKTEKSLKAADGSRVNDLENLPDCLSFCNGAEEVIDATDEVDHLSKASQQKSTELTRDHLMAAPHLSLQAETEVLSETHTMTSSQEVGPLFHNIVSNSRVISSEVQFENANCNIEKDASKVPENCSCSMHDGNKQVQEQAEMKPFVDADSEWIKTEKSLKAADGGRVNDLANLPDCLSFCKGAEEVKNVADEADHLSNTSQVRDANIQAIDFVAPVQSSKNGIHSLNDDMPSSLLGDSNQEWAETFEFHHGFCVVKQTSFCDHVSSNNACLLPGQSLSSKPSIDDDVIQSVRSVPETFDHCDGLTDCSINCPQEFFRRDFGLDVAVKAHQLHEGNAPTGHEIKEVAFHSSSHIVELQGGSGSMLLDCKDQVSHNIPNCQMELTDVCLNSECIMESDLGDTNLNSKFNTLMHVEVVSKFNERNDHELFLGEQVNHYDEQSVEAAQSQGSYDNRVFEDEKSTKDAVGSFTENFTDFVEICESSRGNANNVSRGIIEKHENNHVEAENMVKERENHFQSDVRPEDDFDISVSAVNSKSPMVELDTSGSFQECSESQIFNVVTGELSIMNQDVLSDDDLSSMDISSTESEDSFADTDSIVEGTILNSSDQNNDLVTEHMDEKLECSDTSPREALVSGGFADSVLDTEVPPAVHSSDLDMDKNSSDHHMHADAMCFPECEISVKNDPCSDVCKSENHSECREYDTSLELDSSLKKPGALIQVAGDNIIRSLPCSSNRELESVKGNAMSNDDCQQTEAQLPSSSIISQETTEEDEDATSEMCKPENDEKKGALTIKPPPDAVPFSDEWLAAFEAAGEEILTMKSGAVQNSPPDKSGPEPSPWSPVRRKNNQEIGPFDCTKFAKIDAPMSTEVKEK